MKMKILVVFALLATALPAPACDCYVPGAAVRQQAFAAPAYTTGGCAAPQMTYAAPAQQVVVQQAAVQYAPAVYAAPAFQQVVVQRQFTQVYTPSYAVQQQFVVQRNFQRQVVVQRDIGGGFGGNNRQFGLFNFNRGGNVAAGGNNRQFGLFNFSR